MNRDVKTWTVWRRLRDSTEPWQKFQSVKGVKRDVLVAMQEADRHSYQDVDTYEYHAMEGEQRPAQYQTFTPTFSAWQ